MSEQQTFPVDETTLVLLEAACNINPDSGHTELGRFLDMFSVVKSVTNEETGDAYPDMDSALADHDGDSIPVFFVEHEDGHHPWSPHGVILALIAEIRRLRAAGGAGTE